MPKIPKQGKDRGGGFNHRDNYRAARRAGGRVPKPPRRPTFNSKGKLNRSPCVVWAILLLGGIVTGIVGLIHLAMTMI